MNKLHNKQQGDDAPLVSVVIPTANRPELLRRAIRSVLDQTYQHFELIIVDDGQRESAQHIPEEFSDPRIIYHKNETSLGGGGTRNVGATLAKGVYVAFLDDDDEWNEKKLELQVSGMQASSQEVVASFTGVSLVDEATKRHMGDKMPNESGVVDVYRRTLIHPYIWTSALMVERTAFHAIGGFDVAFTKNQEWDLVLRLAKQGKFFAIDLPLTICNVLGEDAHMGGKKNIQNIIKGHERLLEKHKEAYQHDPSAFARVGFILAQLYVDAGDFSKARKMMFRVLMAKPFRLVYWRHALVSLCGSMIYGMLFRTTQ